MSSKFDSKFNTSVQNNTNIRVDDVENRIGFTSLVNSFVDFGAVNENYDVNTVEEIEKRARNTQMMRSSIQVLRETKKLEDTEKLAKFDNNIVDYEECSEVNSDKIGNAKRKINQMTDDIQRLRHNLCDLIKKFQTRNDVSNTFTSDERLIKTENLNVPEKTNSSIYSTSKAFWVQHEKPNLQDSNTSKDCENMPCFKRHHGPAKNIIPEIKSIPICNEIPEKKQLNILGGTICFDSEEESLLGHYLSSIKSYPNNDQKVDLCGKLELSLTDSMLTCIETIRKNKKSEMFENQSKLEAKMNDYDTKFDKLVCSINELVCNEVRCQVNDTSEVLKCTGRLAADSKNVSANTPVKGTNDYDQTKCNFEECVCKLIGAHNDVAGAEVSGSQDNFNKLSKHTEQYCTDNTDKIPKGQNLFPQQNYVKKEEKIKNYSACSEKLYSLLHKTVKNNNQNFQTEYDRTIKCSKNRNVQSTVNMTDSDKEIKNKPLVGFSVTRCGEILESRKENNDSTSNFSNQYSSVYRDIGNILHNPYMTPEQKVYETSKILRSKKYLHPFINPS